METDGKTSFFDKRLIIGLLLTIGVAMSFWTGSRYPDLQEKASIGAERDLQGIAFDVVLPVEQSDPVWKRIVYTTVNWAATNKKGMAFGLVFAACLLTILGFIEKRNVEGLFANTFKGFLIGAPMGLCVNCAAPVAFGLKRGGAKPETALGAMLSSPSMNVIVIGMMFSLLPWYLAALKLAFSLALIFVFVPLLVRLAPAEWMTPKTEAADSCRLDSVCEFTPEATPPSRWLEALGWTVKTTLRNVWKVGRQTVPLMVLAGFLGSALITLLPFELVKSISDLAEGNSLIPTMIVLALVGVFLPVPMAFDVVMVVMLMGLGIPTPFAMVLLLTLGSYSVYSYLIVAKAFSQMAAIIVTAAVVCFALAAGLLAPKLQLADRRMHTSMLTKYFKDSQPVERKTPTVAPAMPWAEIETALQENTLSFEPFNAFTSDSDNSIRITSHAFQKRENKGEKLFRRDPGEKWGFDLPTYFSIRKFVIYPHLFVRGMASGDVHGDGYPDVLVCGDPDIGGLYLFANLGGKRFVRQELDLGELNEKSVLSAALVDFSNDGWLDIVFTTLDDGNYLLLNRGGQFPVDNLRQLSRKPGTTAVGIGFHDFDRNGRLDMFVGNYSIGHVGELNPISHESSRNQILYVNPQGKNGLQWVNLPAMPGETHGLLAMDFNRDGLDDFICYNDWAVPDMLYLGRTNGTHERVGPEAGLIPITTHSTMSIQAADIDNDLQQEIYVSQISKHEGVQGKYNIRVDIDDYHRTADTEQERALIETFRKKLSVFWNKNHMLTFHFIPEELRQDWMAYHIVRSAAKDPNFDYLSLTPEHRTDVRMFLRRIVSPWSALEDRDYPDQIPQNRESENVFLKRGPNGALADVAKEFGIHRAGWTWHAGFADLDHDEFQDLYVATGFFQFEYRDNNTFFHNRAGKTFELKTDEFGLSDYAATSAFNYADFDRDGDLDVLSLPVTFASVRVFENQGPKGNSISFQLRDAKGNRFAIGSTVVIRYGENGQKQQRRDLRRTGGFVSWDPQELHFGLGDSAEVRSIEIRWPDSSETRLIGPFPANRCYRIARSIN